MGNSKALYTSMIKNWANQLGFLQCGIAPAGFLENEAPRLENWLKQNHQGEMHYMENHFDKRLDPRLLVDGAKSVISLTLNYYTNQQQTDAAAPRLSKYAYGTDYHDVIKQKLKALLQLMQEHIGEVNGRAFVDSAPVMDKAWAQKAGLGWMGKNSNLLSKKTGSFFFLAELIVDLELDYNTSVATNHCGTCTRCIDACPTEAIVAPYVVDGSRCISYLTIELKEQIPTQFKNQMDNWMFGCDVCQDVCPWNSFATPHQEESFNPHPDLLGMTRNDWMEITEETFKKIFKGSAVKRAKYAGLVKNIRFVTQPQ
jgi:epoxyqueuosine reductase